MTKPTPLRLHDYLPYRLALASHRVSRMVGRAYRARFGLSIPEWRVIAILGEEGEATAQGLGDAAGLDKVSVSRAVRALVERGLVEKRPHGRDRRSSLLRLTPDGEAVYADVAPAALAAEAALVSELTGEEERVLAALLERVRNRAQALLDDPSAPVD
ncbi:MarR family transcriptional regulator [Maricaulis sp.]|uniref:MarR family winged helix-turn-helix transcriptional regulator n=1 Tax=Maricaulis sp. TaxID=1486257 RepID=UPI0026361FEF|nr:MarR family transcriptional regulator [Maricaulis sp.]